MTRCDAIRIMGWDRLIEYLGEVWKGGLRSWGWLLGRAGRWREASRRGGGATGDYYERIEGYCLTDGQGNIYVASVKWVFQVMEDGGRRFWFEGLELGRAKAGSIDEVIARITGGAVDRAEGKRRGGEGQDYC